MNTLENPVLDAFAVEVLCMLAPAPPFAVAELEVGVPGLATTLERNSDPPLAFKVAELPIPFTVTSLLSVEFAAVLPTRSPVLVEAALKDPLITPFAAELAAADML